MNLLSLFTLFSPHRTQISMTHSLTHPPVSNTGWVFLGLTVARFAVQVERWSELSEPAKNDAGAAVWLQPAGSGQFYLYMRVCVCGFSLCQPAGHGSSHWEATYWRAACQWPEKQEEEGKKWDSPPVTGTTTWRTEAAKIPETKKNPSDQTCLKSWKHPVWLVHVSHGITDFWCHPVGHFEGIFFPLPSQNNLNKFSAAYFNFQSIFDVLFVWLCLPECKKKRKKISMCTDRQPLVAHLPCARLGLILIYFFLEGIKANSPHASLRVNTKCTRQGNLSKGVLLDPGLSWWASRQ